METGSGWSSCPHLPSSRAVDALCCSYRVYTHLDDALPLKPGKGNTRWSLTVQSCLASARERKSVMRVTEGKNGLLFAESLCHSRSYPVGSTEDFVFFIPSSNLSILLLNKAASWKGRSPILNLDDLNQTCLLKGMQLLLLWLKTLEDQTVL